MSLAPRHDSSRACLEPEWRVSTGADADRRVYLAGKRLLDIAVAASLLVGLAPLLVTIAAGIMLDTHGAVFYRAQRIGLRGRRFTMIKFRTMLAADRPRHKSDRDVSIVRDSQYLKPRSDPRTTPFGKWLRRWSLDELPNLLNVLAGDMSLVGPRPAGWAPESYGEAFEAVFSVKPGVTGLWQVMGRSDLTFAERIALDCEYVRRRTFRMDVWILLKTIPAVLTGRGAY